jgi:hypothetical protein
MAAATSPDRTVVSAQRPSVSVADATYLGLLFKASVIGLCGIGAGPTRPLVPPASRTRGSPVRSIRDEMSLDDSESSSSLPQAGPGGEDLSAQDLIAEGGTRIVWEDRWHEEEIFANRLSFYILAQSFLVAAAVTATLSSDTTSRWLPVALTIDLAGLLLTIVFWYALTENLRRLDTLKELVAEGSRQLGVRGYREIAGVRRAHHEHRAQRALPFPLSILPRWSPSWWLAHGVPGLLLSTWIALITVAIATA